MNFNKYRALAKIFTLLSGCTLGLFIALGIGGMLQSQWVTSPISSMKGLASSLSNHFFVDMIAMELPSSERTNEKQFTFSGENITSFLFHFLTDVQLDDPRSMLAMEVPGMGSERAYLLRGQNRDGTSPQEYTPSRDHLQPHEKDDSENSGEQDGQDEAPPAEPPNEPEPSGDEGGDQEDKNTQQPPSTENKVMFIYHSHNRESWVPELEGVTELSDAFDPEINVTLVGKRMAERLEEHGIGAVSSEVDYPSQVPGFNYNFSYKYSLTTVREASAAHPDLQYFFDIHRDAQKRDLTTVTIDGVDYAQVYFVIGQRNPDWEKNEAFANEINNRIEEKYPGLSRGVWGKSANTGHAEYNQSISPNSILVEVGGPENTLEESYRTIEILADIVAEYYWEQQDAEKADAPVG